MRRPSPPRRAGCRPRTRRSIGSASSSGICTGSSPARPGPPTCPSSRRTGCCSAGAVPARPHPSLIASHASGLASLVQVTSELNGSGAVERTILEMEHGILAVVPVADDAVLTVAAGPSYDRPCWATR
ncbi:roadblock/LC7 domain-containing protein [Streptomyces sp. x-19]|uniref:roadblock/LC7 domain-containing protein n=1 Tax=Streptomyces sp. x-19 TaxID=2789280 RepID=UPI00397FE4E0